MLKHTRQNRLACLHCSAHTGLLFISPPKRSDFCSASRTGLLWRSVNSSRIRYENRYAPMQSGIVLTGHYCVIFKLVSSNLPLLLRYFHFWSDCELITTGNTILKLQTIRRLYPMSLQMPEIDSI